MLAASIKTAISPTFLLDTKLVISTTEVTAIFGASGSGKTSLLRCIAGLTIPHTAHISMNGDVWQDETIFVPTHQRRIGYVFQQPSLFSHLTVQDNLAYATKRAKGPTFDTAQVVDLLDLAHLLSHKTDQLSGGEAQRVGIARALLNAPRLMMMDEPLAALDQVMKNEILPYLRRIPSEFNIPVLYVSHALDEVVRIADHMVLMGRGSVVAVGEINQVLTQPSPLLALAADASVAWNTSISSFDDKWGMAKAEIAGQTLWLPAHNHELGDQVRLRISARDVSLTLDEDHASSILNRLPVTVLGITATNDPATVVIQLGMENEALMARITAKSADLLDLKIGSRVWAQIKSVAVA